ncbi:hypothetical protein [uncultured Eubacterium sp.]|uniref:hypothetical protein n=1 Tax=uncultured Eubacterium sp. TaxID=165185 RepID=UPI002672AAB1|nr:hypothetical protein [uncultured Eubacterium sp.]
MTYESYIWMCYICAGLSGFMLLLSVFLFFKLKIIGVVGDLTGSNAKKAIRDIRERNKATGNKAYKPSEVNQKRGRVTDKISNSGNLYPFRESSNISAGTEKLEKTSHSSETQVLDNHTTLLQNTENNQTTVLKQSTPKVTTVSDRQKMDDIGKIAGKYRFSIEYDITFTHATERIDSR